MSRPIKWIDLPANALIRQRDLLPVLPFAAATLWRRIGTGQFPRPIRLTGHITAWRVSDVLHWLDAQGASGEAK